VKTRLISDISHGKSLMQRFIPAVPIISPSPKRIQPPPIPISPEAAEFANERMKRTKAIIPAKESAAAAAVMANPVSETTIANAKSTAQKATITGNQIGNVIISKKSLNIITLNNSRPRSFCTWQIL